MTWDPTPDGSTALGIVHGRAGPNTDRTTVTEDLGADRTARLHTMGTRTGTPPDIVLAALWALLLTEYTGDLAVTFGYGDQDLHVTVDPDDTFAALVHAVTRAATVTRASSTGPTGSAVATGSAGSAVAGRSDDGRGTGRGTALAVGSDGAGPLPATVTVRIGTTGAGRASATFDRAAVSATAVSRLLAHLGQLLDHLADAAPDTPVGRLTCLSVTELDTLLHRWNATSGPTPGVSILDLVDEQARRRPAAVAVLDPDRTLSYAELLDAASRFGTRLTLLGVRRGDLVPLAVDRGVDAVVAMLGVLTVGAAFVPVEESWPDARMARVLGELAAPVLVTGSRQLARSVAVAAGQPRPPAVLHLAAVPARWPAGTRTSGLTLIDAATAPPVPPTPRVEPVGGDLAYVLFTSGSTGVPKGVAVGHSPVVNLLTWVNETFSVCPDDQVLLVTPLGFDLSVYSVLGPLAAGGSVRVATHDELADPARLLEIIDTEPVTVWNSAPAALAQVEPYLPAGVVPGADLRLVLLSGDWIPVGQPDTVREAFPKAEVVALGGPTETTVWSNYHRVGDVDPAWASIPYGWPIRNVRRYVLDDRLRPVPVGVPGQLYVGGACLAHGYHGDPELTRRRFLPDPFVGVPGARMYATGDRVRLWDDGTMEFLGRVDNQVKIRGHRIELSEIEAVLQSHPQVHRAVAHLHRAAGGPSIVGYVVPVPGARPDPAALLAALGQQLPGYMLPGAILLLDRLPTTANGKVDRGALPAPPGPDPATPPRPALPAGGAALSSGAAALSSGGAVLPSGGAAGRPVGATAATVWRKVLGAAEIRDEHTFAGLGGHSLAAAQATAQLSRLLHTPVPLRLILTAATFGDYVARVEALVAEHPAP
ncbi:non-ribosomal peptide synthetase [Micromonospora cathayae]|uniref:Amino acid adenylation domain-containing protein n=1 Tax=Micromonospora cathayae TaxID=3028804 RepID=A0ABY7ZUK2_9ACTN|nr:amino acid adenylation domain-containing protein [Micromonospora sp. HUAS 3]WDZ85827.1 amino acid adenylation domain-containing protein [Micromonospora sp. HUAS 3]